MQFLWQLQRQLLSSISTSRIQVASNFKNIQKWRQYGINPLKQLKWKKNTQNTDKNISSQTLIVNQSFWYTCIYAIMHTVPPYLNCTVPQLQEAPFSYFCIYTLLQSSKPFMYLYLVIYIFRYIRGCTSSTTSSAHFCHLQAPEAEKSTLESELQRCQYLG